MDQLESIVRAEVKKYAGTGTGINLLLFPLLDDTQKIYAVNAVDYPKREEPAGVIVLARIVGDKVIIEEDMADKKLVDALLQQGIARSQIILAYDDEPIPQDAVPSYAIE
jgi:hypothetical protein